MTSETFESPSGNPRPLVNMDKENEKKVSRREYFRQYYRLNKERCDANLAKYREKNRERVNESGRRSKLKHQQKRKKENAAYYEANNRG